MTATAPSAQTNLVLQARGLVLGTLVGALIVGVFRNGLQLAGVDVVWQGTAIGLLVLVAVGLDQWIRKVKA